MKVHETIRIFLLISFLSLSMTACMVPYQLGQCDQLTLDLDKGTLNGVKGTASMEEVKKAFPCFTGDTEEGSNYNCGGGVFFLKNDFYFYTHRDYIEVRGKFTGDMSRPTHRILGENLEMLSMRLGKPSKSRVHGSDTHHLYKRGWGTLVCSERNGAIALIQLHYGKGFDGINPCL